MKRLAVLLWFSLFFSLSFGQRGEEFTLDYEKYTLPNGLDVILHIDRSDPIVALAIRFHVGSGRETPGRTGFAHLFEHMMFQRSENVGEDQFFKLIQDAGGTLNGGTGNDATTYFEVVPKNALEKILWMESDRMGYMINTVTLKAFNIQQNVVQNEKRQSYDNQPYGHVSWVVATNLYPKGHPYSWTVIGEMEDLTNATVEDVKAFHRKFYNPNNATLVLAGDFDVAEAKKLIEKYFGDIPKGEPVPDPEPVPVKLAATKKVFHEDNFAKSAQLRMVWPTVEEFHPDSYPLSYLGQLLSQGKKAPLYRILEKERKLVSRQYARNSSQEIAGTFNIIAMANENVNLNEIEKGVFNAFEIFENEGFTDEDVERIKASLETDFYNGISSILGKSFQFATYNESKGDPGYFGKEITSLRAVTREDIMRVYRLYLKDKPFLATSFVPKGQVSNVLFGSEKAAITEESIADATQVEISETEEPPITKTPARFDRSIIPPDGPDPVVNLPVIWQEKMKNGLKVMGIEQKELPLVQFSLEFRGGHSLDPLNKPGIAGLMCDLMMEGTRSKTPLELEEEIERLGASISMNAGNSAITIRANTLARNYEKVVALVEEILTEPRWDTAEFSLIRLRTINNLKRQKANPSYLASLALNEHIYGKDHILSTTVTGTEESVASVTIEDLKNYYRQYLSPLVAAFNIAGDVEKKRVMNSLKSLETKWKAVKVAFPAFTTPPPPVSPTLVFVDVPGAKQSVINIGYLGLAGNDPELFPAYVMNYKLGGSFNGKVNLVLREEKGYTYGARTGFTDYDYLPGPFLASSSVRSSATTESVEIFRNLMAGYADSFSEEDLNFTRNAVLKGYARQFETLGALTGMMSRIFRNDLPPDYITREQKIMRTITVPEVRKLAVKYIDPNRMYYVVAGDAATQKGPLEEILGKP